MTPRCATVSRTTRETTVACRLVLDGDGSADVSTGLGFDHMLEGLSRHAGLSLSLQASGDLVVDDHHTVEDCALVLGEALETALGDKRGLARFGHAYAPLDEALARWWSIFWPPWSEVNLGLTRETLGSVATENLTHFFRLWPCGAALRSTWTSCGRKRPPPGASS